MSYSQNHTGHPMKEAWPVAVFAHNEAKNIVKALDSLLAAELDQPLIIYVLANGCTDDTEDVVRNYARRHREVSLISIQQGDKAGAWNQYVHEIAPQAEILFFTDGDVQVCEGALTELRLGLKKNPYANAATSVPATGRNAERLRRQILSERGLMGNLYALRGDFVKRIQERGIRLPSGFIGDDSLVGALAKWDLDPHRTWDDARIVPCAQAFFRFEPLSWWRHSDWRLYWRRINRYNLRAYQIALLSSLLKREGLKAIPRNVFELYQSTELKLRWDGIYTPISYLTLRRIRKAAFPKLMDRKSI